MKSKTKPKKKKEYRHGPKPKYKPEFVNIAYIACREGGFTDVKLAKLFSVSRQLIMNWKHQYPEFKEALIKGKDDFDTENVEQDLLKNARGFKYKETTMEPRLIDIKNKAGKVTGVKEELRITKVIHKFKPGSTTAQIYWLNNRDKGRWRNTYSVDFNDLTVKRIKKRYDGGTDPEPEAKGVLCQKGKQKIV